MHFIRSTSAQPVNVLFIGKRFYTNRDALNESYGRIYQLPNHWALSGIATDLWLIDYHSRESARKALNSLSISSMPLLAVGSLKKALGLMFFKQRYTHIVATGDCYIGLLGYLIAKRSKARFIFDVYDKYDDFSGYRRILGFDLFGHLLKHANHCLFASRSLFKKLGRPQKNDLIVANGVDTENFRPRDLAECRLALGLPQKAIYIGYFGGMEPDRGVDELIEAAMQLRREGIFIEILIGGKPVPGTNLDRPVVRYVGNVPFREMPLMLGACNLLAVPYRRSSFMDAGASNKIAEALACMRPLVATSTPNLVDNFADTASILEGRLAEPGNSLSLAQVIQDQLKEPRLGRLPAGWDWSSIALAAAYELDLLPRPDPAP